MKLSEDKVQTDSDIRVLVFHKKGNEWRFDAFGYAQKTFSERVKPS